MELISLNLWHGKLLDPLTAFLARERETVDIFCFQEVTRSMDPTTQENDLFASLGGALDDFNGFFEPAQEEAGGAEVGLATFVRKKLFVEREGDAFVFLARNAMTNNDPHTIPRNAQYLTVRAGAETYAIVNFHGLWTEKGREDNPQRIEQSKKLKKLVDTLGGKRIVCGDFNLTKDTESLSIIDHGMRNLIKERGITSTRNRFFPYPDKYCDYAIVDNDIDVKDFKVLPDEVSDHLALKLTFE